MRIAVVFDTSSDDLDHSFFMNEVTTEVEEQEYEVAEALMANGHEVRLIGVRSQPGRLLDAIRAFGPDLVFNCAESFRQESRLDYVFATLLEAEGVRYTGTAPLGLLASRNKGMSKKLLAYHGIRVPGFEIYHAGDSLEEPDGLAFPLIVKPLEEDASEGIAKASVVHNPEQLRERVAYILESFQQPAIAEEFIEGRELYVGVIGNGRRVETLPIVELVFDKERTAPHERIATKLAKWDEPYRERWGIRNVFARPLAQVAIERIDAVCQQAFRALWLRDYARLDVRLTADNEIWVMEANANPFISFGHDMANAAEKAGMDYYAFIERLVTIAKERYDAIS